MEGLKRWLVGFGIGVEEGWGGWDRRVDGLGKEHQAIGEDFCAQSNGISLDKISRTGSLTPETNVIFGDLQRTKYFVVSWVPEFVFNIVKGSGWVAFRQRHRGRDVSIPRMRWTVLHCLADSVGTNAVPNLWPCGGSGTKIERGADFCAGTISLIRRLWMRSSLCCSASHPGLTNVGMGQLCMDYLTGKEFDASAKVK